MLIRKKKKFPDYVSFLCGKKPAICKQKILKLLTNLFIAWLLTGNGFQGTEFSKGYQLLNMKVKIKMQTAEQQRHFLRMLEKSLAREMDLEKKFAESRQIDEELKLRLISFEQEVFDMEEEATNAFEGLFEAENVAEIWKGNSKELLGRLEPV